jgi:hypothetical protein
MCNTVYWWDGLFSISAKQAIIYYQYATKIFINVLRIACMMNTMIRWCIEYQVKEAKLFYFFSVY